jgi:hypothetical protein
MVVLKSLTLALAGNDLWGTKPHRRFTPLTTIPRRVTNGLRTSRPHSVNAA